MDKIRFERLKRMLGEALRLPEADRSAYLDRECAENPELREEAERLLREATAPSELDRLRPEIDEDLDPTRQAETATEPMQSTAGSGACIGPYRLLEKMGEGGMGEVWVAEQTEPVKRRVAVKLIKRGMDSDKIVARFEAERQALAMMDHPAIAKVFDAGQTPDGRPYFVMEHVDGVAITEHCDRHKLTTRERLELFAKVCDGVQHAHQKAVIHRDIKPSNVLVTVKDGRAEPKIIDFGVAKATAQRLTEKTVYTELGVLIGTPEYMSPEQAEMTGQSIDTRTDVYSLGVLLYELLTGVLPFDSRELRAAGFDEIRRKIREVDPLRPSTRLGCLPGDGSTLSAKNRKSEPGTLTRQIRGELDWITMRALEKDRTRRYGSASDLSMDVIRYLRDEPVSAGPPSGLYRARKFVKRHKVSVGVTALLAVILIGFSIVTTIQARRIAREAATADQVSEFLVELFNVSDPSESRGNTITAREVLDRGAERIGAELDDDPEVQARLMTLIGRVYLRLGLWEESRAHLERALARTERRLGPTHLRTLAAKSELGTLYWRMRRDEDAERLHSDVLAVRRQRLGENHPDTLDSKTSLALVYWVTQRLDQAERLHREVLEERRRAVGPDDPLTLSSMNNLATVYWSQKRHDEAKALYEQQLDTHRRVHGEDHPETLRALLNLAELYESQGHIEDALDLADQALEARRLIMGDLHPDTLASIGAVARMSSTLGDFDRAEALLVEELKGEERVKGEAHVETIATRRRLIKLYERTGRFDEAKRLHFESVEIARGNLDDADPALHYAMFAAAVFLHQNGQFIEAEKMFRDLYEVEVRGLGEEDPKTLRSKNNIAVALRSRGDLDAAEAIHAEVLATRRRVLGESHPDVAQSAYNLACLSAVRSDKGRALDFLARAVEAGYAQPDRMLEDDDLTSLRGAPEFEALVAAARRNASDKD